MLSEFVAKIQELATTAGSLQVLRSDDLRRVFVRHGTELLDFNLPPLQREPVLESFGSVIDLVKDEVVAPRPEVYIDEESIRVLLDRNDRHERAVFPLQRSERFQTIKLLSNPGGIGMAPSHWVRKLRFELPDAGVDGLIKALRKVDFTRRSDGSANVQHGKESFGQSVELAVQQAADVPETFMVTVPVFADRDLVPHSQCNVTFGVFIDLEKQQVVMRPLADEVARAELWALERVSALLCEAAPGVPVFRGTP